MSAFFCFLLNAAALAINIGLYAANPDPIGLSCIVFLGIATAFFFVAAVTE